MSQINLIKLKFSNMFSYGKKENIIEFNKNKITQLTAPNGSGKSSIALILQEVLFNKNVKGIKKSDIVNRWVKSKEWLAELEFSVDKKNIKYLVEKGSIAINGVSLTIANIIDSKKAFEVAIIPQTFNQTNFKELKKDDYVNVEFDIIGKQIVRLNTKK